MPVSPDDLASTLSDPQRESCSLARTPVSFGHETKHKVGSLLKVRRHPFGHSALPIWVGKCFGGTDSNGMLVSLDEGRSWVRDATFPSQKLRCLLSLRGKLYAGTDAGGVFSTGDDGQTWSGLSAGFPSGAQVFAMTEVDGVLFAGLYNRGLFAWDEQKHSWSQIRGVQPLALASADGALIAGHNPGGLYWSRDLGVTWSKGITAVDTANRFGLTLAEDSGELLADAPIWEMASNDSLVFARRFGRHLLLRRLGAALDSCA